MRALPALLALSAALGVDAAPSINGWYPCGLSTSAAVASMKLEPSDKPFECAEVDAPLCHDGVCNSDRKIPIFVKRLLAVNATGEAPTKAAWLLQGGPGGSSVVMEYHMLALYRHLGGTVDMYTTDHRGTGRSFFLQCDAAQAFSSGSPSGVSLSPDEIPDCVRDVLYQIDNQTAAFSVTSAAKDMELLVTELNADQDVYVYGASYGTFLTERLMHLEPENVKGYVLDGVVAEDRPSFMEIAEERDVVSKQLAAYCDQDKHCSSLFANVTDDESSGAYAAWMAIYDELDALEVGENPCVDLFRFSTVGLDDEEVSSAMKSTFIPLVGNLDSRTVLPGLIKLIHRCQDEDDLAALQLITKLEPITDTSTDGDGDEADEGSGNTTTNEATPTPAQAYDVLNEISPLLMTLIKTSEMWNFPSPSWDDAVAVFSDTALPGPIDGDFAFFCLMNGNMSEPACDVLSVLGEQMEPPVDLSKIKPVTFKYQRDEYYGAFATIPDDASVVLINGKLDFNTPRALGVREYENLDGGRGKMMVEMDYGGHCTGMNPSTATDRTECGYSIIASYIAQDGDVESVDTACLESLPSIRFFTPDEIVRFYVYGEAPAPEESAPGEGVVGRKH